MIVIYNEERTCHEAARIIMGSLLEDANSKRLISPEDNKDTENTDQETIKTSEEWTSLIFDMMAQYLDCDMGREDWIEFIKYSINLAHEWEVEKLHPRLLGVNTAIEEVHQTLTTVIEQWGHKALMNFLKEESYADDFFNREFIDSDSYDEDEYTEESEKYLVIEEEEKEVIFHFDGLSEDLLMIESLLKDNKAQKRPVGRSNNGLNRNL